MSKTFTARQLGELNRASLKTFFDCHSSWTDVKTISQATGQHVNSIHIHCRHLIRTGYLEEAKIWIEYKSKNSGRHVIHYRRKFYT